ncbi:tetratricopeptide repeat protein [Streptomyces sp. NPDC048297]|uniref:tetratricopeptide repeat protein n=1 Tax=Streptomyces sp. NPDC048297 TaxID=3365531 RepID=UPI0037210823
MQNLDTASFALKPFVDLSRDPKIRPSRLAEAALYWAGSDDPFGLSPWQTPARDLREMMLRAGPVADDPLHGVWQRLTASHTAADLLWASRLATHLGRYDLALRFAESAGRVADDEERCWADLLMARAADTEVWATARPVRPSPDHSPVLRWMHALDAWERARYSGAVEETADPLAGAVQAAAAIRAKDQRLGCVAEAQTWAVALRHGAREAAERDLGPLLAELTAHHAHPDAPLTPSHAPRTTPATGRLGDFAQDAAPDEGFLVHEALLRLHLAVAENHVRLGDLSPAASHAATALRLDPHGAGTHLVTARIAQACGHDDKARVHYRSAARHGLVERGPALAGMLDLDACAADTGEGPNSRGSSADSADQGHGEPRDTTRRDRLVRDHVAGTSFLGAVNDLLTIDPAAERVRLARLVERRQVLERTAAADTVAWASGRAGSETSGTRPSSLPLPMERYRPYFDLAHPQNIEKANIPPVAIHMPLMSLRAVTEGLEPWFSEVHPQRATAAMFRTELAELTRVVGHPTQAASTDFVDWLNAPDGCPLALRDRLEGAAELPMLERAMVGRLLASLGFYTRAMQVLPDPTAPVTDPESAFALATWLYAQQMHTTGSDIDLDPEFRRLYGQLGDDDRYARMRVVATINATVNAARRRRPDVIAYWRTEGESALARYVALPEVDEFNGALMTSRWYRAMGFLPYLTGDRELLVADMDQWLGIAAELKGHDDHTRIIAADNYFPAVETAVRTHVYLGDMPAALRLVEELAFEVDSVDPKTWLTAGELYYQAGDVRAALSAYLRAAHLQFPYGRLSWFNAGQCHEELGQVDEAAECYRRSLQYWPAGLSPVRRLHGLVTRRALGSDSDVVAAWTARQKAWPMVATAG